MEERPGGSRLDRLRCWLGVVRSVAVGDGSAPVSGVYRVGRRRWGVDAPWTRTSPPADVSYEELVMPDGQMWWAPCGTPDPAPSWLPHDYRRHTPCTCDPVAVQTVCADMRNEKHLVGCPRWGKPLLAPAQGGDVLDDSWWGAHDRPLRTELLKAAAASHTAKIENAELITVIDEITRRIDRDSYGLKLAEAAALRADCSRRQVGAVIIAADGRVVATGYNGAPSGEPGCLTDGACPRAQSKAAPGEGYEFTECIAVHAEMNAIIYAGRDRCLGSTLYVTDAPCYLCTKVIAAAGIERVVVK